MILAALRVDGSSRGKRLEAGRPGGCPQNFLVLQWIPAWGGGSGWAVSAHTERKGSLGALLPGPRGKE